VGALFPAPSNEPRYVEPDCVRTPASADSRRVPGNSDIAAHPLAISTSVVSGRRRVSNCSSAPRAHALPTRCPRRHLRARRLRPDGSSSGAAVTVLGFRSLLFPFSPGRLRTDSPGCRRQRHPILAVRTTIRVRRACRVRAFDFHRGVRTATSTIRNGEGLRGTVNDDESQRDPAGRRHVSAVLTRHIYRVTRTLKSPSDDARPGDALGDHLWGPPGSGVPTGNA
jgi:hypothetical protein